jgi:starch synthase (maltosyl-transferring)
MDDTTQTAPDRPTAVSRFSAAGRRRVVVEHVRPEIDGGRFPIKRTVGEQVTVTVDMFADGHDQIAGALLYRARPATPAAQGSSPADAAAGEWREVPLQPVANDSWTAAFTVDALGAYEYTVEGWVDTFGSWLKGLVAKAEAGQDVSSELLEGAEIIERAAGRLKAATPPDSDVAADSHSQAGFDSDAASGFSRPDDGLRLLEIADKLRGDLPQRARVSAARDPELKALMDARPDRAYATRYDRALTVTVDVPRARYSTWYEMFPRSVTPDPTRSGTFREAEARLPAIQAMGFDVVYLPPVHPIGRTHRKGRNNSLTSTAEDPGSPWAIGGPEGGHTAIEPGLGTLEDFDRFVGVANRLGLEVALDIAFQASPDHPWVREHPEWFKHRPDGTIKYAENPPKKYQDIYPLDFESAEWESLWTALRDVFLFWASHGVRTFRVDNPHTKSFRFWEWCIAEVQRQYPDTIFLAEAFTRPKVMRYLAKAGFSQSYTYFTWRNQAWELREYLTELTKTELQEYMRPNFFANTPDILNEYLVHGGRPAFEVRLVLAATLAASYGIYSGFELCENVPVRPGSEEYLDSEKYQIKVRDYNAAGNLNELIARVNQIRREHPALQQNSTLAFHATDNPQLLFYSKSTEASGTGAGPAAAAAVMAGAAPVRPDSAAGASSGSARTTDRVFVVATTDHTWEQAGWIQVPIWELGIDPRDTYIVEDLLDGARYTWRGEWNFVKLGPGKMAHVLVVAAS